MEVSGQIGPGGGGLGEAKVLTAIPNMCLRTNDSVDELRGGPSPSLWGWIAFRDFGTDHREKRLRQREVGFGGDHAFACLLKESEKLRVRFRGKIAFGHFEHGFLLSVLRRPRWAALRRRNQAG